MMQFLAFALLGYSALALGVYLGQRRLLYPVRGSGAIPKLAGATLEKIPGKSGRTVYALYAPPPSSAATIAHFHGNGEELENLVDLVALYSGLGFGVLAVEYPGYGLARPGEPTEAAIYDDAEVALRDLVERKQVLPDRIVLSGQSLGSGVAVEMARRGHGARVVLYSPYTSIADVAAGWLPFLPHRLLLKDRFDSASKAREIRQPVLVVHGSDDEVIPFALGRELSSLFPNGRFLPVEQARHNDLFVRGGGALLAEVARFAAGQS
jgi:fermentation-respiration switch protein FrsA (DUF1100 family)